MRQPVSLDQVSRKLRPAPPPLEANDQVVTAVITAAWAIGLVSLLVLRDNLRNRARIELLLALVER